MEGISFFSEVDIATDKEGKKYIASEYPYWYNRQILDELEEEIRMAEYEITSGRVSDSKLAQARDQLNRMQRRLDAIQESFPKLDDKTTDFVAKARKDLGKEISAMLYTRSDMKKGLANVHDEARRMVTPSIKLSPDLMKLAESCNVKPVDGKVSRNQASKMWQIASRILNENTNVEVLRRD